MRFHLCLHKHQRQHTRATLFINGAMAGILCFRTEEAEMFVQVVQRGAELCAKLGDPVQFQISNSALKKQSEAE